MTGSIFTGKTAFFSLIPPHAAIAKNVKTLGCLMRLLG
jgi:hypothetical protein